MCNFCNFEPASIASIKCVQIWQKAGFISSYTLLSNKHLEIELALKKSSHIVYSIDNDVIYLHGTFI